MSDSLWCDLTTEKADTLADYYVEVMGWKKEAIDMGDYNDYVMMKADGTPAGGICHKKGCNENMPNGLCKQPLYRKQNIWFECNRAQTTFSNTNCVRKNIYTLAMK